MKFKGSGGVTALIGMPGFEVGAALEVAGEWWLAVQTTAGIVGCAGCGSRAVGHGRRRVRVRDLAVSGRPVVVVLGQADLALPRRRLCGQDMDRDLAGGRGGRAAHGARRGRDLPPRRG